MKEITFEQFINYNKRIGKMIISGDEGSGKDLLTSFIGVGKMLHGFEDCCKSYEIVDDYNSMGYNFSKNYEHLCFSNFDINCRGTEIPHRKVYKFKPSRLGFYDPDYWTDLFPPYALFCATEAKSFLDAYEWEKFPNRYVGWIKTMRHARYDMVVNSQCFGDICVAFRKITNRFIYLHKECEEIKNSKGEVVGHKLFVIEWKHWRDVDRYEQTTKQQNCEEYTLILNRCGYENYDSYMCKLLHLKGRENQDFLIEHFPEIKTVDDVNMYADELGFTMPEGFYKTKSKVKEEKNIEEDIDDYSNFF